MAKKEEQISFLDKAKTWWETDTAKAIATIVAVLLIPASVIAWNYATNKAEQNGQELSMNAENEKNEENNNENNTESNSEEELTSEDEGNQEVSESDETLGQESSTENPIGGLAEVQELPDTTSSFVDYTVKKGDNVYSISINVCGNDSYYLSNMNKGYLKVGQVLKVACN